MLGALRRFQKPLRDWEDYYQPILPRQLIHGDLHAGNVLFDDRAPTFIDFDKTMVGPRVFDLEKYIPRDRLLRTREDPTGQDVG